jgi:hypothetical protein
MSKITVKELEAPTGFDLKIAAGETLDLKSQGSVIMPTGSILQVKQQVYPTFTQIANSSSHVDTGLTLAITPTSTSSKILVTINVNLNTNNAGEQRINGILVRDNTTIETFTNLLGLTASNPSVQVPIVYLDSPSTTSSITYKLQVRGHSGSTFRINNWYFTNGDATSTITLMEVAG